MAKQIQLHIPEHAHSTAKDASGTPLFQSIPVHRFRFSVIIASRNHETADTASKTRLKGHSCVKYKGYLKES